MQYIVLDLEWNQPTSYNSIAFRRSGGKLLFEIIQIGAVRLNEKMQVTDSFSSFVHPVCYTRLNPRITKITHIEQEDLEEAPEFCEAVADFAAWCGEDYALLTWGCDDVSVFDQNMQYYQCGVKLAPMYDMQRLFSHIKGTGKDRMGLKVAMDSLEIEPDEEQRPFHNAVNDAYYTARVFQTFEEPEKVLEYPLTPKKLEHTEHKRVNEDIFRVHSKEDGIRSHTAQKPPCPVCGKKYDLTEGFVRQTDGSLVALSECENHGLMLCRLRFSKNEEGKKIMIRSVSLADEQNKAYVATKHLQWQAKLRRQAEQDSAV